MQKKQGKSIYQGSVLTQFLQKSDSLNQFDKLAKRVAKDAVDFEKEFSCNVNVFNQYFDHTYPYKTFDTPEAAKDYLISNRKAIEKFYKDNYSGDGILKSGTSCGGILAISKPEKITFDTTPACTGSFEHLFSDNTWKLPSLDDLKKDKKFNDLSDCLKIMIGNKHTISRIDIDSSSSQLNNTGEASTRFCEKGFKELSKARALSAWKRLKTIGSTIGLKGGKVEANYKGENGNGTSGECPYELIDGKEVLKKGFEKGGNKRNELDKSKYVNVKIIFKPNPEITQKPKNVYHISKSGCYKLQFKCAHHEDYHYQKGWPKQSKNIE